MNVKRDDSRDLAVNMHSVLCLLLDNANRLGQAGSRQQHDVEMIQKHLVDAKGWVELYVSDRQQG